MNKQTKEDSADLSHRFTIRTAATRFTLALVTLVSLFFLPAWTLNYWQAWLYILVLAVPMVFIVRYLYKYDPILLKRRMRIGEKQQTQKFVIILSLPLFILAFVIPGFDHRLHWSGVPIYLIIISDMIVLISYLFIGLVFKTNSYASRIVEVEKGQKVISTGPYAVVRHPMYLGVIFFYTFSPLALGSYWAVIPALLIIPILVARITGEEKELITNLEGYKEYMMKTKYRLVPKVW